MRWTSLTQLDLFLWAAGFLLNLGLLFILWYRRRYQNFPFFTSMVSLSVIRTVVLCLVRRFAGHADYVTVYWSLGVADTSLQLAVVYEVASKVFRPVNSWACDLRKRLAWVAGFSVLAALTLALMAAPSAQSEMEAFTLKGTLFGDALMSELFVATMMISLSAGLPFRSHTAAVAQGLGAYSLIGVLIRTGHAYFGTGESTIFIVLYHIRMVVYLGCALFWMVNLYGEEEPARTMTGQMSAALSSLQLQLDGDLRAVRFRKR